MKKENMKTGIIVFAHGSRDPRWCTPIEALSLQIQQQDPETSTRCAYLELCKPTLEEAANELIAEGIFKLKIFPVFFGVGKHAREDLPLLVEAIQSQYPDLLVELLPTAGESPQLISLMAQIALS